MSDLPLLMCEQASLERLEAALDEYWAAPLGQLNVTAEALRRLAWECGYVGGAQEAGPIQWARERVRAFQAAKRGAGA